jgi:FkbM family methyltransferase
MIRSLPLAARRVQQTLRTFDNGPRVLADLLTGRLNGRPHELRFETRGLEVTCPNKAGARVPVYEIFAEDAYRIGELTHDLGSEPTVLDIGAQVGCFSVALASAVPGARVHAYEASPVTAKWLRRNVRANGLDDRVAVHEQAVGGVGGTLEFWDNGQASGLNGDASSGGQRIEVPCVAVADAVRIAGPSVDLVKIDTEGAEYSIVLDSPTAAWSDVRRVVMEYHDVADHSWAELREYFAAAGLREVRVEASGPRQGTAWLSRD